MRNMSHLPRDILNQIMERLTTPELFRFAGVCTSWRSASAPGRHKLRLPWLIVPSEYSDMKTGNIWFGRVGFFSILDGKVYYLHIPEMKERRICGSSNGWLITVHESSDIGLLHPFSKEIIKLPSLLDFPGIVGMGYSTIWGSIEYRTSRDTCPGSSDWIRDNYIRKAIVSSKFTRDKASLVVMVIAGKLDELLFCRLEIMENTWIQVQGEKHFFDVTYYNGKFYAVDVFGNVFVVEGLDSSSPFTKRIIDNGDGDKCRHSSYLIKCSGNLLKVVPFVERSPHTRTIRFQVLKLDFENKKWLEVKTLGNHALFVGSNHGICISTSGFPGCKGNSIYYTENHKKHYTLGIYNVEDGKIEKIYSDESGGILPWPIWYAPIQRM
ncbi:hypothetical protein AQUCO_01400560v1 [Aquilegia coerulea]|uniref:F-box domain-containing protein n=1 Tax=Aquilegia coerulea TaxID=218851 RepID=A0A2G5DX11_AQUCA|nr:hypothetical protein AQUCO_01400560v1 [Aquilegia coerulea]